MNTTTQAGSEEAALGSRTLVHALERRATSDPDGEFARFGIREPLSTAELWDCVRRFSASLLEDGVGPGDRVLISLESSPEFLVAWLGTGHAGAVMVPLVPAAGRRTFSRATRLTEPRLAVVDARAGLHPDDLTAETEVVEIADSLAAPISQTFARRFLNGREANPSNAAHGLRPAAVLFTSGTTGPAKGATLPHAWYVWASEDVAHGMGYGRSDVLYTCLPLGHANAQDTSVGPALIAGARIVLDERFSASRFWERVAATSATACNLIANMPRILLDRPRAEYVPQHRLRQAFAIPALPPHRSAFRKRFGVSLRQGYGSTEIGVPVLQTPTSPAASCGRPVGGTRLRILGDDGVPVAPGENGEICVWSPRPGAISPGYWRDPEATAAVWSGGWFRTGDTGHLDDDGELYFTGRLADVIRRKGESLTAYEIESVIGEIAGVADCAVIGTPQDDGEDAIVAYVVPQPEHRVDVSAVIRVCKEQLGAAAAPSRVEVTGTLPRTGSGKVAKGRLKASVGSGKVATA